MTHIDLINLPLASLIAIVVALFVAGTTKGLIGVGMPIVAVPLLSLVVDLPIVVGLLSIPLIITNIPQAVVGDRLGVVLRRLTPIFAGLIVGVIIGVSLLTTMNPAFMKPVVGIILIAIALSLLFSPHLIVPKKLELYASPIAGLIGGIAGGIAALPGPFVFIYLLALGIKRDQFVQYSSMFLTVAALLMAITLGQMGALGWNDAIISTVSALPIFLGMWVGSHIRQLVSPELFRKVILGVVMVSGVNLIMNGMYTTVAKPVDHNLSSNNLTQHTMAVPPVKLP
jgi:uncharacterized membrane protein YfcA